MKYIAAIFTLLFAFACTAGEGESRPLSTTVTVTFDDRSAAFAPPMDVVAALSEAPKAAVIYVSGRTSAQFPSPTDEELAFQRAAAARAYLIKQGVSPLKIMVNYASGRDFAYDNTTEVGRIYNQRVDIELVFVRPVS